MIYDDCSMVTTRQPGVSRWRDTAFWRMYRASVILREYIGSGYIMAVVYMGLSYIMAVHDLDCCSRYYYLYF